MRYACLLMLILLPTLCSAEPVTFSYTGVVDLILQPPPEPFANVQVGDPIQVDYILELATPDQDEIENAHTFSGAVVSYQVAIGGNMATTVLGGVNTVNAGALSSEDTYAAVGLFEGYSTSVSFMDPSGVGLSPGDTLATIDLSAFESPSFLLLNGLFPSINGSLQPVPEPGCAGPFLVGLLGTVFAARCNRRR